MEAIGLIVSIIGLVYFIFDRYSTPNCKFEIDKENIIFCYLENSGYKFNKNICLALYNYKIINTSNKILTIKDILLEYEINGKIIQIEPYSLLTGLVYSPHQKEYVPTALLQNKGTSIFLMNWINSHTLLIDKRKFEGGDVITCSSLFILKNLNTKHLKNIKNLKIIINDFKGKKYSQKLEKFNNKEIHGLILHKNFKQDKDGVLKFT